MLKSAEVMQQKYNNFSFLPLDLNSYANWNKKNFKKKRNSETKRRIVQPFLSGRSLTSNSFWGRCKNMGLPAQQNTLACTEFLLFQNIANSIPNIIYEY